MSQLLHSLCVRGSDDYFERHTLLHQTGESVMTSLMKDLDIDRLSLEDRIALMHELWDSIAAEPGRPPLSDSLRRELERRMAEHQANPTDAIPWEQIKAEALARFQQ